MKSGGLKFILYINLIYLINVTPYLSAQHDKQEVRIDKLIELGKTFPEKNYFDIAYENIEISKNLKIQNIILQCMSENDRIKWNNIFRRYLALKEKTFNVSADSVAQMNRELDLYKQKILENYPEFAFFVFSQLPTSIEDTRTTYLQEREALLNYKITDHESFIFVITPDTFHVVRCAIDKQNLNQSVQKLLQPLYGQQNLLNTEFDIKLAHILYKKIFEPVEEFLVDVNSVIIIPDDVLVGFPFGCLVVEPDSRKIENKHDVVYNQYEKVTFLIHKYAVAYNYSSVTLNPRFQNVRSKEKLGRKLLTMNNVVSVEGRLNKNNGLNVDSPLYGEEEVQHISRIMWRNENLKSIHATEEFLKENGNKYRWLYFSIPGIFDNENVANSRLLFSATQGKPYSELYVHEIINLNLRADLLTLTGCETKPADRYWNSGVIAIPQAFLMGGVQSVLFNLWRVNDMSVTYLMTKFYFELKYKRQTNSLALQRAKIASLTDTFEKSGQKISRSHPRFWAQYMLVGNVNVRPPTFSTIPPNMVILITYIFVLTVSLIIVRKTIQNKKRK